MKTHRVFLLLHLFLTLTFFIPAEKAESATQQLTLNELSMVNSSLLSLTLRSLTLELGELVPYVYNPSDGFEIDENGNIWLLRQKGRIGVIVGPQKDFLYQVPALQQALPSPSVLDKRLSYSVSSADDQNYSQPLQAEKIGRKSKPVDSVWTAQGLQVQIEHIVYIQLPLPLQQGRSYRLSLPPIIEQDDTEMVFNDKALINHSIHFSQLGYRTDAPEKYGYLSMWAGSLGAIDFSSVESFHIIDEASGEKVFSAVTQLKKQKNQRDEDAFLKNYTLADVYVLDFSSLNRPGDYYIWVEGVGRSLSFTIGDDIWGQVFLNTVQALYAQRCGTPLQEWYAGFDRPRCHHQDDGVRVLTSGARLMDTGNGFLEGLDNFSLLVQMATDIPLENGWGGYHDAGDWDRRIQHLQVTRNLLALYEQFPDYFAQLSLPIPEMGNGLPDIIDEALWSLDFFGRLQEPDGGVRGGIESDGHPYFGEPSRLDKRQLLAYHPGIWSTYLFAATAAKAARIVASLDQDKGAGYRQQAINAMQWAEAAFARQPEQPFQVNDSRNLAAVELFALTGEKGWHDIFTTSSALTQLGAPLFLYENHDQAEAAWEYILLPEQQSDPELRANCIQAVLASAELMITAQAKTGFGWLKYPWRPPFAGAFTIPFARDIVWAWQLTGDSRYLGSVETAMQTVHGVNPLNLSYTSGTGDRAVSHVTHLDSRIARQATPTGISVLGPLDLVLLGTEAQGITVNYGKYCYPKLNKWPVLETFFDVFWIPLMNEFSIETMGAQMYTLGFLAAHQTMANLPAGQ